MRKLRVGSARAIIFVLVICYFGAAAGCAKKSESEQARQFVERSQDYYGKAVNAYKELIAAGKNPEALLFELGRLYYDHRDFRAAAEQFQKTNFSRSKKLLAVSYYQLGNFSDALEVFNEDNAPDDEARYYHGLTCEKLNLYGRALDIYRKIKSPEFVEAASLRLNSIEKQVNPVLIKDLDPWVFKIMQDAPSQREYPQAGALILSCREKIKVTSQNTVITDMRYIIKILNERGREEFSETQISYDSTYEKVELEYARTIKPDGSVVDVGTRHIRDVSKYLNFPMYSNVRVFIISFPEVAEGSVIEYKLKVYRNQMVNKKDLCLSYPLQSSQPLIYADFQLEFPENRRLNLRILNEKYNKFAADLKPMILKKGSKVFYRWKFKNIPQIIPESNMPASVEINPAILISTFDSWSDIYNWWRDLAKDKINADTAIKQHVENLTERLDSQEAKARAIYNFCAQKIRYVGVEYGQSGYEPHKAEEVFKNKYGDCKDQAILLVTMLRAAGLKAFPVLIPTRESYNLRTDFPSSLFNHCIAAVSLSDKIIFLDPTAETCPFDDLPADDQNRNVLLFLDDDYKICTTPLYPAEHNLLKHEVNLKINTDESINSKTALFTSGVSEQRERYWLLYTPPQLVEEAIKEEIQNTAIGSRLDNYTVENLEDLNNPVLVKYEFNGKEYLTDAGLLRIMPQLSSLDAALAAADKRDFPIDFGVLYAKEIVFNIEIPDNFTVKYIPGDVSEESPWLKFTVEYKQTDNRIYFRQKMELKSSRVTEEDYVDFRAFFEAAAKKIKQRIVFETTETK